MKIDFFKAELGESEINAVTKVIESGWLTYGKVTERFEELFRGDVGSRYALAVNSCTSALHLAFDAIGVSDGDEVILPTNTFVATAEAVTYCNGVPVLCDINYSDHNIDVSKIEDLITERTVAICPVHFAGKPCDMEAILDIAKRHNLYVIEDSAHALPARHKLGHIGTLGDITCFSFYATKTITTGEGGMITTDNEKLYKKMKSKRLHGVTKDANDRATSKNKWEYDVVDRGYKYNTTDIASSIGIEQLNKAGDFIFLRQSASMRYRMFIDNINGVDVIEQTVENGYSSYHLFVIRVDNRDKVIEYMQEKGVQTSVHFKPIHMMTYYKEKYNLTEDMFPNATDIFSKSISLPIYPSISFNEIKYVCSVLEEAIAHCSK